MNTYYIKKPQSARKTLITIVVDPVIDGQDSHLKLLELSQITDLFFVFTRKLRIKHKKFANLYNAAYYSYAEEKQTEVDYIWEAIEYIVELDETYSGICFVRNNIKDIKLPPIVKMSSSLIETSIFKLCPLNWEEYKQIYTMPDIKLPSWIKSATLKTLIKDLFLAKEYGDNYRMFASNTTVDPIIFLRPVTIRQLSEYFVTYPRYLETFKYSTFEEFISSSIYQICSDTLLNRHLYDAAT